MDSILVIKTCFMPPCRDISAPKLFAIPLEQVQAKQLIFLRSINGLSIPYDHSDEYDPETPEQKGFHMFGIEDKLSLDKFAVNPNLLAGYRFVETIMFNDCFLDDGTIEMQQ